MLSGADKKGGVMGSFMRLVGFAMSCCVFGPGLLPALAQQPAGAKGAKPVGVQGLVGCLANPKKVDRLLITKPGIYENYLVDSNWEGGNRVKITADNVT